MATRLALLARDDEIRRSVESAPTLAARYGVSASLIRNVRRRRPAPLTGRERFELEVIEGGWSADCMEPDEWALWVAENPRNVQGGMADRPCRDCPASFAAEMRAIGRCNGTPTGHEGEPAEHEEEERDVIDRPPGGIRGQQALQLAMPPCGSCQHEPICVLKIALGKVKSADVTVATLPDGLAVVVSAKVDCRFYNKAKGTPKLRNWSPEQRQAAADRLNAGRAPKAPNAGAEA